MASIVLQINPRSVAARQPSTETTKSKYFPCPFVIGSNLSTTYHELDTSGKEEEHCGYRSWFQQNGENCLISLSILPLILQHLVSQSLLTRHLLLVSRRTEERFRVQLARFLERKGAQGAKREREREKNKRDAFNSSQSFSR